MGRITCGVCLGEHATAECPRRRQRGEQSTPIPTPRCASCEALRARVAELEALLTVTETPPEPPKTRGRGPGRPKSGNALTPAEKQRRYRERNARAEAEHDDAVLVAAFHANHPAT